MNEGKDLEIERALRHAQTASDASDQKIVFHIMSPAKRNDLVGTVVLAVALTLLGFGGALITWSAFPIILGLYPAAIVGGLAAFFWTRSRMKLVIKGDRLACYNWRRIHHFHLANCIVSLPHAHSYGGNEFEHVVFEPETDTGMKVKVFLPDPAVKGDLVRERFLAEIQARGADVRIPGFMPPRGGINEVDEVKTAASSSGLSVPAWIAIPGLLLTVVLVPSLGAAMGFTSLIVICSLLLAALAVWIIKSRRSIRTDHFIIFSPEKLASKRGSEIEWEIPREMLQGLIVESRKLSLRSSEVRVVAKTPYHRSLTLIDWSTVRLPARCLLLAHARARGIPVEIRVEGAESGPPSLVP